MKMIILGNGFDLHHGLETSFSQFRNYLVNHKSEYEVLVKDIDEIVNLNESDEEAKKSMTWNHFEKMIGAKFKIYIKTKRDVKILERILEDFVEEFYKYLVEECAKSVVKLNKNIQDELIDADIIMTFNYTELYNQYNLKENVEIFHIHGRLAEDDLPVIGFYDKSVTVSQTDDYEIRYRGVLVHKPARAFKQNSRDLDERIKEFCLMYSEKVNSVTSIGYSYGESDLHIFDIFKAILIKQTNLANVNHHALAKMDRVDFKIFSHDTTSTSNLINSLKLDIETKCRRRVQVMKTGVGFRSLQEELICFTQVNY